MRSEAEKLFERARKREPKIFSGIHTVLMRRMLREFRRRSLHTRAQHSFTLSRQLMMAAEYLGEACRMNPEEVYEFGHFLELLQERVEEYRKRPFPQDFSDLRKLEKNSKRSTKFPGAVDSGANRALFAGRRNIGRAGVCFCFLERICGSNLFISNRTPSKREFILEE